MSDYPCTVCNKNVHCSELHTRKVDGIESLVCESCIEWNEVGRYLEE